MEREPYSDEDLVQREIDEQTQDPDVPQDTEFQRRSGPAVFHDVNPNRPRERAEAVFGDTDTDPLREDQPTVHQGDEDEHV